MEGPRSLIATKAGGEGWLAWIGMAMTSPDSPAIEYRRFCLSTGEETRSRRCGASKCGTGVKKSGTGNDGCNAYSPDC